MIGTRVQKAIFDALTAAPALADGRVFDRVPEASAFPRITIGGEQIVNDGNSCGGGWEVYCDVHVWSQAVGFPEAKTLAASVVERLSAIAVIDGFNLVSAEFQDQRSMRDPDGLTSHVVCSFLFIIDEA